MITYLVAVACVLLYLAYAKLKATYDYWESKGIKGPEPQWLYGNIKSIFNKEYALRGQTIDFYNRYPNEKFVGFYQGLSPTLLIRDPDTLKRVLIQDFGTFVNRGFKVTDGPLSKNMFEEEDDKWRILRQRIAPIFTSGKLKQMMPLLNNSVKEYVQYVDKIIEKDSLHELKAITIKYTTKTIMSAAFGLDIDTFNDDKHIVLEMAAKLTEPNMRTLAILLNIVAPGVSEKLDLLVKREVTDFFINLVKQIRKEREGKPKTRNDFMDLMIKMREQGTVTNVKENSVAELEITDELMAAQAAVFYVGGFDTSASTMAFLLYELGINPSIQDRCYEEVKQVIEKYNGEFLSYDALNELQYLSMALEETLRKYPIASELFRVAGKKYTFPETNLTIDKGTQIVTSIISIQNDPKYFPDPEKFIPERFAPENKGNIKDCTYMPFGEGPRICIGMRFGKVQTLLGIAHFLYNFRVEPSEKTIKKFNHDPCVLSLTSIDGLWLNIRRR